jgi:hypothetical protein
MNIFNVFSQSFVLPEPYNMFNIVGKRINRNQNMMVIARMYKILYECTKFCTVDLGVYISRTVMIPIFKGSPLKSWASVQSNDTFWDLYHRFSQEIHRVKSCHSASKSAFKFVSPRSTVKRFGVDQALQFPAKEMKYVFIRYLGAFEAYFLILKARKRGFRQFTSSPKMATPVREQAQNHGKRC